MQRFETPRRIRNSSGGESPWHLLGTVGDPLAGVYEVKRENTGKRPSSPTLRVMVYGSADEGVPAYVVAECERQHAADMLADVVSRWSYPRPIIERDGFMLRVFVVTPRGLANVTGYLATAYGFRLRDRSGGRRWIQLGGGGYSPEDHIASALQHVLGLDHRPDHDTI